jgi:large subunit ribosomal protein L25
MAEIVLNVEVRDRAGKGGARAARRDGRVPGILYGGERGPVAVSVRSVDFRKALYTGKLLGRLVTLKYGEETQPVIAKDVQFHPVTDEPVHFDLYRVDEHQLIRIAVPIHFRNQDASPGLKRGGTLNIVSHDLEISAPADSIPEELIADLTGLDIGDSVRASALALPDGVSLAVADTELVIATVTSTSSLEAEEAEAVEVEGEPAEEE